MLYATMFGRSVLLAYFLVGSSAAFAVRQQPAPPAFDVRSHVHIEKSNSLGVSGRDSPELSVRNILIYT